MVSGRTPDGSQYSTCASSPYLAQILVKCHQSPFCLGVVLSAGFRWFIRQTHRLHDRHPPGRLGRVQWIPSRPWVTPMVAGRPHRWNPARQASHWSGRGATGGEGIKQRRTSWAGPPVRSSVRAQWLARALPWEMWRRSWYPSLTAG